MADDKMVGADDGSIRVTVRCNLRLFTNIPHPSSVERSVERIGALAGLNVRAHNVHYT